MSTSKQRKMVEATEIVKAYGSFRALDRVSFDIYDGERAPEDELSAEAFRSALISGPPFQEMAFQPLRKAMLETAGGRNLVAVGMGEDVDFAAHADRLALIVRHQGVRCGPAERGVQVNPAVE